MSERTIVVERAGLQSLIVDRGRFGMRDRGVAWCGALDQRSLAAANELVQNDGDAAAIEVLLGDCALRFETSASFALAGADCAALLDGVPVAAWRSHVARAGSRLVLRRPAAWMRTIVAFAGGIDVPRVLGSRTTDLVAAMGGLDGRVLRAGDRFVLGAVAAQAQRRAQPAPHNDGTLRTLPEELAAHLWDTAWTIGHDSNRMGVRLRGNARPHTTAMTGSRAVFPGFIQLPPSGEPIVLMSDAQTTGGYPLAGVVIEDDLWKLAQAPIGATVRFVCRPSI